MTLLTLGLPRQLYVFADEVIECQSKRFRGLQVHDHRLSFRRRPNWAFQAGLRLDPSLEFPRAAARWRLWCERGLADTGFVEGKDVAIEYRWAEGTMSACPKWRGAARHVVGICAALRPHHSAWTVRYEGIQDHRLKPRRVRRS